MFKLNIEFNPEAPPKQDPKEKEESFLEKIRKVCHLLEGPTDNMKEWRYAKSIYKLLKNCNHLPPEGLEALKLLQPQIARGAQFDAKEGGSLLEGDKMNQWMNGDDA